ncbi:hypothetical protein ElyMa_001757300 [Elysia marginata]|uniref:Uncharacterized protein n=1 Tax=Elysia marginata TaxID=1093978 RepID=A0AAV4EB72_9GAST|nr:hypothetical protein ElyMa_001757300 [Elysia marginata]
MKITAWCPGHEAPNMLGSSGQRANKHHCSHQCQRTDIYLHVKPVYIYPPTIIIYDGDSPPKSRYKHSFASICEQSGLITVIDSRDLLITQIASADVYHIQWDASVLGFEVYTHTLL